MKLAFRNTIGFDSIQYTLHGSQLILIEPLNDRRDDRLLAVVETGKQSFAKVIQIILHGFLTAQKTIQFGVHLPQHICGVLHPCWRLAGHLPAQFIVLLLVTAQGLALAFNLPAISCQTAWIGLVSLFILVIVEQVHILADVICKLLYSTFDQH
ncbi:MAG: hypothetical protein C5S52_00010 [ANME-2 cluster archaeon]|nr:hypothetical protein [ANME-2 cluster archaeon]